MKEADANNRPAISHHKLALPQGGGAITGLGQSFEPSAFSGTGNMSIPVHTTPARKFSPELSLAYSSGAGNGPYGIGFSLSLPKISRQTNKGIPKYTQEDIFILSGEGQLTPQLKKQGGAWVPDQRTEIISGVTWTVLAYRPRGEGAFALIEQWINPATGESYWQEVDRENVTHVYGKSQNARIADPEDATRIFEWLIEEAFDGKGNRIVYTYKQEDQAGVTNAVYEVNRSYTANRYIHSIQYGPYYPQGAPGAQAFAFEVIFDYGEYDLSTLDQPNSNPYQATGQWLERKDPFSRYTSGFEIRTYRLCRNILMFHHFTELGTEPCLVRATQLTYDQTPTLSLVTAATQIGYRRRANGSYAQQALPPLTFTYSQFDPQAAPVFKPLTVEGGAAMPGRLSPAAYLPVDLNSEGLPGFLYSDAAATFYYAPMGQGSYSAPAPPEAFPDTRNLRNPALALSDLDSDGQLELVVSAPPVSGYYAHHEDGSWGAFQAFEAAPTVLSSPAGEHVDLDNDGKMDLLLIEDHDLIVYPSEGTQGYGAPRRLPLEADFPTAFNTGEEELVTFAGIFGDGLSHRVRVCDGSVEAWPTLGYGRFGKKVTLARAPPFDQTTSVQRIFFADIDGSGTADLVLAYSNRVEVYLTQSGNSFAEARVVWLPETLSTLDQITFADILGYGATALVFTKMAPQVRHWYCVFVGETQARTDPALRFSPKPYLLNRIDNNLGATTEIKYSTSTKFYLADKQAGRPWATHLPFPVQVVEEVVNTDQVSGSQLTSLFKYHDGYYDPVEREFRGFGFVESWDTQTYAAYAKSASNPGFPVARLNKELYVPPVYTKTWHHTGAYLEAGDLAAQYRQQYYQGDAQAHPLPGSVFDAAILEGDVETLRQAYVALKGHALHQEVYAVDADPALDANPYTVSETNYRIQLVQPVGGQKYASFYVHEREAITYDYERNPADPRIKHDFTLKLTIADATPAPFYVEETCNLHYARRPSTDPDIYVYPEQAALKATVHLSSLTRVTTGFRMIGQAYERQVFELNALGLPATPPYTFDTVATKVAAALQHQVDYGADWNGSMPQARMLSWDRAYFWNLAQTAGLPLGQVSERALLHHDEQAAFSETWLNNVYGTKVDADLLVRQGGYTKGTGTDDQHYWWNKGLVQYYATTPEAFYLPSRTQNDTAQNVASGSFTLPCAMASNKVAESLFVRTDLAYDQPYALVPVKTTEYLGDRGQYNHVTTAEIAYQTMEPWQLTDVNEIIHQVLLDPLSKVIATSIFKKAQGGNPRTGDGDLTSYTVQVPTSIEDVLANRQKYLQQATTFFYYDLSNWQQNSRPASYVSLARLTHVSDLQPRQQSVTQAAVGYSDGFGRMIEEKHEAEPGPAILRDAAGQLQRDNNGRPVIAPTTTRWIVSGRTVFNNKGKPAEQYLPYYSNTAAYETQKEIVDEKLVPPPTILHYDPLEREIRVDTPKGFFTKVTFTPWEEKHYDEDDTVKESAYYKDNINNAGLSPEEKAALNQAARFYNTPTVTVLDNAGHTIRTIANNLGAVPPDAFAHIVRGGVTSQELWDDLKTKGYLVASTEVPRGRWVTGKFQPYTPGFKLDLDARYQPFADAVTAYLLQNDLTSYHAVDIQGRVRESIDPRLYYDNVKNGTNHVNLSYAYAMDVDKPWYTDSADAGQRWQLPNIFESLIRTWDSRGFQVCWCYDRLQRLRLVQVTNPSSQSRVAEIITYGESRAGSKQKNLWGRVSKYQDQAGVLHHEAYNLLGQVIKTNRQLRQDYQSGVDWSGTVTLDHDVYRFSYTYDALKRLTSETTPNGSITQPTYYISNRLQAVQVTYKGRAVEPVITEVIYNANGQRLKTAYANKAVQTFTYEDTTNRLINLKATRPATGSGGARNPVLQDLAYTYDPVGNVTQVQDKAQQTVFCYNQQVKAGGAYTYDALYRLTRATGRQHPGIKADTHHTGFMQSEWASLCPPSVNDQVKLEGYTETYGYDLGGNLLTTKHTATSASFTRTSTVAAGSNRLATVTAGPTNQAVSVSYDDNGNLLKLPLTNTVTLGWDYRNNLSNTTLIQRPGSIDDADYFDYDYQGRRIRKVVQRHAHGGAVTQLEETIYLGDYLVKRIKTPDGQDLLVRQTLRVMDDDVCAAIMHYWVQDTLQREVAAACTRQLRYQLDNHLGSVTLEVDTDAALISYEEYYPYGGTAVIAGKSQAEVKLKLYRYSGKERDDSTGLYYYGARYYAPWLGRWLKPDPAGTIDGLNLYAFVGGNPITFVDSEGYGSKPPKKGKKQTHAQLGARFKSAGVKVRSRLKSAKIAAYLVKEMHGHSSNFLVKIVKDHSILTNKKFGPFYRAIWDAQDELVSTSSVREFISGVLGKKALPAAEEKTFNEFLNNVSRIRFPTKWSGFANTSAAQGAARMQHPTSPGAGIWRRNITKGSGNPHSELDRQRREAVVETMEQEVTKGGSLEGLLKAVLVTALVFTLNNFTAPATASDQHPETSVTQKERVEQVEAREQLKATALSLGAVQDPGADTRRGRAWGDRRGKRSLSPPRNKP